MRAMVLKYPAWLAASLVLAACSTADPRSSVQPETTELPLTAPLTTESAGQSSTLARSSVLRIVCRTTGFGGTGFLHASGHVITAAHVVDPCPQDELRLITAQQSQFAVSSVHSDPVLDLALVKPQAPILGSPFKIAATASPRLGSFVITWGYPGGYTGAEPLLSAGYFAGSQDFRIPDRAPVRRWVINAAFNGGNSGGPLLSVEHGTVIGVVSSKLAPLPQHIGQILELLSQQQSGLTYEATAPDGRRLTVTEGQLIGAVLAYLRSQVQLVIGYTTTIADLHAFLKSNGVQP